MSAEPSDRDLLARLEARLDRAATAAEGLLAEAARTVPRPPPAGWQAAEGGDAPRREAEVLASLLDAARELVPPELQRRLAEALRELLLAVRALIDWYLERAESRRGQSAEVEEIPID